MAAREPKAAATTLGCLCDKFETRSSMMGSGLSNSIHRRRASRELALAVARVEGRPFSMMGVIVIPRVLGTCISARLFFHCNLSRIENEPCTCLSACIFQESAVSCETLLLRCDVRICNCTLPQSWILHKRPEYRI